MNYGSIGKIAAWFLLALAFCCLGVFVASFSAYQNEHLQLINSAKSLGEKETERVALAIEETVDRLRRAGVGLAAEIASGSIEVQQIKPRLQQILQLYPDMAGIGVYFLAVEEQPQKRMSLPFYQARFPDEAALPNSLVQVADIPVSHFTADGQEIITGRVVVDMSRWDLKDLIHQGRYGSYGFSFVVDGNARFIVHPNEECDAGRKTLFQQAIERNQPAFKNLAVQTISRSKAKLEVRNPQAELEGWLYSTPVQAADWSICTMILASELNKATVSMQRHFLHMSAGLTGFFVFAALICFFLLGNISETRAWVGSCLITLLLGFGIAAIWYQARNFTEESTFGSLPITEMAMSANFQEEYRVSSKQEGFDPPLFVPTGLFIQSINFDSAVDVTITGLVWQKYPLDLTASISTELLFPEAVSAEFQPAYERNEGDTKIFGWNFTATLREPFSYATYPFERENVWIRMWHKDFDKNIVLVPDLHAYTTSAPSAKPGIEKSLFLPSWEIIKSYFSFRNQQYNTNFGLKSYQGQQNFPELYYNIIIRRNFLDPFVSCFLPIVLVLVLMFILILTVTKDENTGALLGFNANVVLSAVAALFFIVIFAQIDIRQRLATESIIYLDYYYFTVYVIFLLVSLNAIIFAWTHRFSLIQHRDNLIPKLLYWPVTMLFLYFSTIWVFYP